MFGKLLSDISGLWAKYGTTYLQGIGNTLILAVTATLIGCVIGFLCGILQTIPCGKNDLVIKRVLLRIVEFAAAQLFGQKILVHEIAFVVVRVLVVGAVAHLFHQFGGGVAQMQWHRQIACLTDS